MRQPNGRNPVVPFPLPSCDTADCRLPWVLFTASFVINLAFVTRWLVRRARRRRKKMLTLLEAASAAAEEVTFQAASLVANKAERDALADQLNRNMAVSEVQEGDEVVAEDEVVYVSPNGNPKHRWRAANTAVSMVSRLTTLVEPNGKESPLRRRVNVIAAAVPRDVLGADALVGSAGTKLLDHTGSAGTKLLDHTGNAGTHLLSASSNLFSAGRYVLSTSVNTTLGRMTDRPLSPGSLGRNIRLPPQWQTASPRGSPTAVSPTAVTPPSMGRQHSGEAGLFGSNPTSPRVDASPGASPGTSPGMSGTPRGVVRRRSVDAMGEQMKAPALPEAARAFVGEWVHLRSEGYAEFLTECAGLSWATRKIAERIHPTPTFTLQKKNGEEILVCVTICIGAQPVHEILQEGESEFYEPNLNQSYICSSKWEGDKFVATRYDVARGRRSVPTIQSRRVDPVTDELTIIQDWGGKVPFKSCFMRA